MVLVASAPGATDPRHLLQQSPRPPSSHWLVGLRRAILCGTLPVCTPTHQPGVACYPEPRPDARDQTSP
eukprot:10388737-Karenia_brevis.AAC.1